MQLSIRDRVSINCRLGYMNHWNVCLHHHVNYDCWCSYCSTFWMEIWNCCAVLGTGRAMPCDANAIRYGHNILIRWAIQDARPDWALREDRSLQWPTKGEQLIVGCNVCDCWQCYATNKPKNERKKKRKEIRSLDSHTHTHTNDATLTVLLLLFQQLSSVFLERKRERARNKERYKKSWFAWIAYILCAVSEPWINSIYNFNACKDRNWK